MKANMTKSAKGSHWSHCLLRSVAGLAVLGSLSACQHLDSKAKNGLKNAPTAQDETLSDRRLGNNLERGPRIYRGADTSLSGAPASRSVTLPSEVGEVPSISQATSEAGSALSSRAPRSKVRTIEAFVSPLPIPQFINVVYGEMLKVPFVAGKGVAEMSDVISLRSSGKMSAQNFQSLVEIALEEYGVRVVPENGTYKIVEDAVLRARIPTFIKSRARQRTPSDLRPIVQFIELRAVSTGSILPLLKETFGKNSEKLSISADQRTNSIVLSGLPEEVNSALDVINELDELEYAGTQVRRYTPKYWNVSEFSQALAKALRTEGWEVSEQPLLKRAIVVMPVDYSNDLFVFAKTEVAQERVTAWIRDLDRPVNGGDTEEIFIYQVKNVDATILSETANAVMRSTGGSAGGGALAVLPQAGDTGAGFSFSGPQAFTVDPLGNRIIFKGTANEYDKMAALLEQLDTPAPEVLIEVQIAEVTLTDEASFGVEFFIDDLGNNSVTGTLQTSGGLALGSSGLNIGVLSGNVDAAINAFANNRRVKILSTPILTARSGSQGSIQVGQDVPVITSQRAANNQNGTGLTDVLQSIEYRKTGVLLNVEPIVFSDNRIDLTISQEVSSTVSAPNSPVSSPTISNRSLATQLSLEDGQTAVLGGLIQESLTTDETGVPFLKDIPGLGQVFSTDSESRDTTELVLLITAYVLRGQSDRKQFVNRLSGRVDNAMSDNGRMYTLKPRQF